MSFLLNRLALAPFESLWEDPGRYRVRRSSLGKANIVDCGVHAPGGLDAGILLARICLADLGSVRLLPSRVPSAELEVQVLVDHAVTACLSSQYAGWPLKVGKYFAMASGSMRSLRGKEPIFDRVKGLEPELADPKLDGSAGSVAVGVLEADQLPTEDVLQQIASETGTSSLRLAVAPTTSIAGTVQVVARCLETALHKLSELKFELGEILSGTGIAPLPPPATTTVQGIGRTNDAILYGGRVSLWVDATPAQIAEIGPRIPSSSSKDYGRPFAEIFQSANFDFYKIDPHLFSPAQISFVNLRDGRTQTFGNLALDTLHRSFHG